MGARRGHLRELGNLLPGMPLLDLMTSLAESWPANRRVLTVVLAGFLYVASRVLRLDQLFGGGHGT